ncbi:MAG: Electron transport complex protein RnfG [Candidatus Ozemobacter sibiricus]|uniref:Ion-translocating oxidoreductase complex subunit G n=1 Tax=Candidatus Ozemobacter sibiricus TaxID=2268124 RepID=A0A367ZJ13_9BACT|nr:MAG: Electron transport complex protein RnfG [Candidatus Ozemobacter sibiricus]
MNDLIQTGKYLFIISAIAGLLLAFTEMVTAPRIAENNRLVLEKARREVLPGAERFDSLDLACTDETGHPATRSLSLGFDAAGRFLGTVQTVSPKGYGGPIDIVLGLKPDGAVSGVKIQAMRETPGLGTKLAEGFLDKFLEVARSGQPVKFYVKKDGGDIDAITAATISSRAFCKGIRDGIKTVQDHQALIQQRAGGAAGTALPPAPPPSPAPSEPSAPPAPSVPSPAPADPAAPPAPAADPGQPQPVPPAPPAPSVPPTPPAAPESSAPMVPPTVPQGGSQ